jgi:hypothetical protein
MKSATKKVAILGVCLASALALAAGVISATVGIASPKATSYIACANKKFELRGVLANGNCPAHTFGVRIGVRGAIGPSGASGGAGVVGATGPVGPQGIQGLSGPAGLTGLAGAIGATGANGAPGIRGLAGANGSNGLNGLTGATGPVGSQGIQGLSGPAGLAGAIGATGAIGPPGTNGARGPQGSLFNYEVDNGNGTWALANMPLSLPNSNAGYLDAGILIDVGQASSFNGITTTSTGDSLTSNVWIADGSEAYTMGQHEGSNFCYGSGTGETFYMMGTCPAGVSGSTLTVSQIQSDFAGYEAYAWVGLDNGGAGTASATITAVDGTPVNATVTLNPAGASVTGSSSN